MTAETDEILHTIKRMVRQSLHDMEMDRKQHEMDKQRYENERMERQAHLDTQAKELRARVAKMQAEVDEVKKTKHHPSPAIIVALIACFGSIVVVLIAAATFWLRNPL